MPVGTHVPAFRISLLQPVRSRLDAGFSKDFQTEFLTNLHDFVIFLPGEITGFLMDRIPLQSQSDNVKTQLFLDLPEVIAMLAPRRIRRSEIGGTRQIAGGFMRMHRRKPYDMTKMTFIICNAQMNIKNKERSLPASSRSALLAANGS